MARKQENESANESPLAKRRQLQKEGLTEDEAKLESTKATEKAPEKKAEEKKP